MKGSRMKGLKRFIVAVKREMKGLKGAIAAIITFVLCVCIAAILYSFPVYFLWNALMPEIFGLTTINVWQALGLTILSACLFGRSSGIQNKGGDTK